ncbi:MAG: site-specific integrase [Candidatus Zixiibacteriota bacterium]|nr:MAG: site-specific integrase [candidate division Zixibacteria bacterium]
MLKELEVKLFKGEEPVPRIQASSSPLPELFRRFIDYCQNNYSPTHLQSDISRITILREFFARRGITYIQDITPGIYEEFESTVLKGRKPKTRKNYLALLKTILNHAVKWGVTEKNPLADVKPPKVVKTFHFFSRQEMIKLIRAANEPLKTGIIILINTGLRRGELFNLRWRDVDLRAKKLRVWPYEGFTPKGKRPRSIPLNDEALNVLRKLKKENNEAEFAFRPYGNLHTLRRQFTNLARELGLKGTLHDLRHTFASHLAMEGVPIPVIKDLLGHSEISTTMIYAHLSPDHNRVAVEKLRFQS